MQLTYTTIPAISRRLTGRLSIPNQGVSEPWAKNFGEVVANEELIQQIAAQKEAYVNSILQRIYVFPLTLSSPDTKAILAEIVENLIVADLMGVYYQSGVGTQLSSDSAGIGTNSANRASQLLGMYCAGANLAIPGVQPALPGQEAVVLPGEKFQNKPPDILSRNEVWVGNRNFGGEVSTIDFGGGSYAERQRNRSQNNYHR